MKTKELLKTSIPRERLLSIIKTCLNFTQQDGWGTVHHEIKIRCLDNELKFVACDGNRIIIRNTKIKDQGYNLLKTFTFEKEQAIKLMKFLSENSKHECCMISLSEDLSDLEIEFHESDHPMKIQSIPHRSQLWNRVIPFDLGIEEFKISYNGTIAMLFASRKAISIHNDHNDLMKNTIKKGYPSVIIYKNTDGELDFCPYDHSKCMDDNLGMLGDPENHIILNAKFLEEAIDLMDGDFTFSLNGDPSSACEFRSSPYPFEHEDIYIACLPCNPIM